MTTCPENVMVASLPHGGNMEVVGCRQSTCIAAVVATGNYRHLYPTFSICEGLPSSMPVLQRQYINPLRRNIECQSTSAFHLGLNLCWKFASPLHQPTTCNSTPNTFIANHFFPTLFSTLFFCEKWRMFWQGFVHTFVRSTHVFSVYGVVGGVAEGGKNRIEKNSARICHVLYIYSNQWTVECMDRLQDRMLNA